MRLVEIGNQPGLCGLPPQQFPGSLTRGRDVEPREKPQKSDDGHVQPAADHAGDVPERHTFVGDPVIACSRRGLLEREPVKMSSIKPMHSCPTVEPVAHIRGDAFFTRDPDQQRYEAVITLSVNRRRKIPAPPPVGPPAPCPARSRSACGPTVARQLSAHGARQMQTQR